MEKHPGILFRTGPAGRRAALAGGPDVWEIARVCRDLQVSGDRAISQTAELMALHPQQVRTALGYYADYQAELDDWIRMIDEEAEDAYASWQRQQKLFAG